MMFLDEIEFGVRRELGSYTFTKEAIIAFATKYDPQPFHVDEEAARRGPFGALAASGWQTAGAWMTCFIGFVERERAARVANGLPLPEIGPSPGFSDLQWLKPVYAGDTVTYFSEPRAKVATKNRPRFGILKAHNTGVNQHGDLVYAFDSVLLLERAPAA